ncbi:amidohydrolase family protein [Streptomyces sp. IBSBF 2394]
MHRPVPARITQFREPGYVHPFVPVPQVQRAYYAGFGDKGTAELSLGGWGWHHEAGIRVLRLILGKVFDHLPDLQAVGSHWGEIVPLFLNRLDDVLSSGGTGLSRTITGTYRSDVWVTPTGMEHRAEFEFVCAAVGLDRVIWSTGCPLLHLRSVPDFIDGRDLTAGEQAAMTRGVEPGRFTSPSGSAAAPPAPATYPQYEPAQALLAFRS